jgi:hypothetical protein
MIRAFLAALAVTVGVGGTGPAAERQSAPTKLPSSVLGILWNETSSAKPRLTHMKPLTLQPIGRSAALRLGGGSATALSPNGRLVAVGTGRPGIQLIDRRRMKEVGFVKLGGTGWVTFLFWQRGLLYAVVDGDRNAAVVFVDPGGRQVLHRYPLDGTVLGAQVGSEERTGQIVLLTAPRTRIGPVALTVAGGKGIESVSVSGISGGSASTNDAQGFRARQVVPGLAIDKTGKRALIVSAGSTVAEVSLADLAVTYHSLSEPVSLLGRLRNWLEPAAQAKLLEGPQRKAAWLGNGLIAVTGADYATVTTESGEPTVEVQPAGLSLIDSSDWSIREISDEPSDFVVFDSSLLAFGDTSWGDPSEPGIGLVGYDLRGRELFHVLTRTRVGWVESAGGLAYVFVDDKRRVVVNAASGRILGRAKASRSLSVLAG